MLNDLAQEIYRTSSDKGFWPQFGGLYNGEDGEVHVSTGRNVGEVLALIHSEVSEALEEWRDRGDEGIYKNSWTYTRGPNTSHGGFDISMNPDGDGKTYLVRQADGKRFEETHELWIDMGYIAKPVGFPSELADILIRVLDCCAAWQIDIDKAVVEKMEYNRTRPEKHGRKR